MSLRLIPLEVDDSCFARGFDTGLHSFAEFRASSDPVLACEHRLSGAKPKARRDPCDDGLPGWRGRRESSYVGGSRGSLRDDGYSAGRYALTLVITPKSLFESLG